MSAVGDDELILRHIPPGTFFQAPGPRVTRKNFTPRPGELGISVTRHAITSAADMLRVVGSKPGSLVAVARVGDVRAFGLEVVAAPELNNPGHAEIRPAAAALDGTVAKCLATLFQFLPQPSS